MLTSLAIRDVVLIDRLDLAFGPGLTVLTGETGAGKSILLDSLGLALGRRGGAGIVREGASEAAVSARFALPSGQRVHALLDELGVPDEDELVLRRVVERGGRSRAWINDMPVGAAALRQVGSLLVEIQGQHDQMGLADATGHLRLLDEFGIDADLRAEVATRYRAWRAAAERLEANLAVIEAARRDEEFLRHASAELDALAAQSGEEASLADMRLHLQRKEKQSEAVRAVLAELTSLDRRRDTPADMVRTAARLLQRLVRPGEDAGPDFLQAQMALERAEDALTEVVQSLERIERDSDADPRQLEQAEERLFALRAAARKHGVGVDELADLSADFRRRLAALEQDEAEVARLETSVATCRSLFLRAAELASVARQAAARALEAAVAAELPPLRLERARFFADVQKLPQAEWGPEGADQVRFLISTNAGQPPGPLGKIASGGELSRLMLALKVVFSAKSSVRTLIFDEVDSGVGGATAAAVGDRLARLSDEVQVLVVTHSPQVAARGLAHVAVVKAERGGRAETIVRVLNGAARREEIARMLAGESITKAARAAAASLLAVG